MPATTAPNTKAIGTAIVAYLADLTFTGGQVVYSATQLEEFRDITAFIQGNGAVAEVYANTDTTDRRGFGGRMWDTQRWYILSLCSMDSAVLAARIYDIRDALVQPFQQHATLGGQVSNLFHSELLPTMRFLRIMRGGVFYRAHLAELETRQEWFVPTPPGVVA